MRDAERREHGRGRRASDRAPGAPAWLRIGVLVAALLSTGFGLLASREISRPAREADRLTAENLMLNAGLA
ncbi:MULTISPECIES: hypothetical protein, partial [unclassified Brevundimonas]